MEKTSLPGTHNNIQMLFDTLVAIPRHNHHQSLQILSGLRHIELGQATSNAFFLQMLEQLYMHVPKMDFF